MFQKYHHYDLFEECDKWFEVIAKIASEIYDMFNITMINEITCSKCNIYRFDDNVVNEHALSISVDGNNINSIQDAIDFFQSNEIINVNCNINGCKNQY